MTPFLSGLIGSKRALDQTAFGQKSSLTMMGCKGDEERIQTLSTRPSLPTVDINGRPACIAGCNTYTNSRKVVAICDSQHERFCYARWLTRMHKTCQIIRRMHSRIPGAVVGKKSNRTHRFTTTCRQETGTHSSVLNSTTSQYIPKQPDRSTASSTFDFIR